MKYIKVLKETMLDTSRVVKRVNAAGGIIMKYDENNRKQILLIQRAREDFYPNFWEFPRGKCDHGKKERLPICASREIKEETGLDVEPVALIDTFEYTAEDGKRLW